jgi:hypothetical protein
MATPGVYSNPAQEAADLDDNEKEAFEQGHDVDLPIKTEIDVERDVERASRTSTPAEKDQNLLVGWDGDKDPENPLNWPASRKWVTISILSFITLITSGYPFK